MIMIKNDRDKGFCYITTKPEHRGQFAMIILSVQCYSIHLFHFSHSFSLFLFSFQDLQVSFFIFFYTHPPFFQCYYYYYCNHQQPSSRKKSCLTKICVRVERIKWIERDREYQLLLLLLSCSSWSSLVIGLFSIHFLPQLYLYLCLSVCPSVSLLYSCQNRLVFSFPFF